VASFNILAGYIAGEIEEIHKTPQESRSRLIFEKAFPRICSFLYVSRAASYKFMHIESISVFSICM
jgi:hypothetical protein